MTGGLEEDALADAFEAQHDDYNKIMVKALADRLAEALRSISMSGCEKSTGAMRRTRTSATKS